MITAILPKTMTVAEFLALPEDSTVERMLVRGKFWEWPMTLRNRFHAECEAAIARVLGNWIQEQESTGRVFSGEVGCQFPDSETFVGIDVAVFSAETVASQSGRSPYLVGVPVLAVEILSPSDTQERIHEKLEEYLQVGVKLVWLVDPVLRTITVHSPGIRPRLFVDDQEISGEPALLGFLAPVGALFGQPVLG